MKKTRITPEDLSEVTQDGLRKSAVVLGMVEANSRPEPSLAAPEIAAMLHGRKPSEIPPRIADILVSGLFLEAELFARKADVINALTSNGSTPEDAESFFNDQLYFRKWAAIAREAAR